MNWKTWVPLVLAIALGLIAVYIVRDMSKPRRTTAQTNTQKAVVLVRDVIPGTSLGREDMAVQNVPAGSLPRNAFSDLEKVVGRVAVMPMVQGQMVLDSLLAPTGVGGGPQALVPAGMRAITVDVNEATGVAGLLVPGCRVDVVTTINGEDANRRLTRTIVQDVEVLAIGQDLVQRRREKDEQLARSVTLLVSPRQGEAIELAGDIGRTRLVLRGALDESRPESTGMTLAELIGIQVPPVVREAQHASTQPVVTPSHSKTPAEPKNLVRNIEVISGSDVAQVKLELPCPAPVAGDSGMNQTLSGTQVP